VGSAKSLVLKGILPATQIMPGSRLAITRRTPLRRGWSRLKPSLPKPCGSSMSNINTISSSDFPESNKGMHYETHCSDRIKIVAWDGSGVVLLWNKARPCEAQRERLSSVFASRTVIGVQFWLILHAE
jgi:hypothetical protein